MKTIEGWNYEMKTKVESHNVIAIMAVSALTLLVGILIQVNWL